MEPSAPALPSLSTAEEWLFGWDPTRGIVSVWATRRGRALVWQRAGATVSCTPTTFRPWLFAASLEDLQPLGAACVPSTAADSPAPFRYQVLAGAGGATYPYLLSARPGQDLEQAILTGAATRLDRPVRRLAELGDTYYGVGPVEQYLMQTGRVYFRGLAYADLHRLQFDLETTALHPQQGRIFLVAVQDSRGHAEVGTRSAEVGITEHPSDFALRTSDFGTPLALGRAPGPLLLDRASAPGGRRRARFSVAGLPKWDRGTGNAQSHASIALAPPHSTLRDPHSTGPARSTPTWPGAQSMRPISRTPRPCGATPSTTGPRSTGLSRRLLGAPVRPRPHGPLALRAGGCVARRVAYAKDPVHSRQRREQQRIQPPRRPRP